MVRTVALEPTLVNVAVLGLLVLVRTFLSLDADRRDRKAAGRGRRSRRTHAHWRRAADRAGRRRAEGTQRAAWPEVRAQARFSITINPAAVFEIGMW